MGDHDLGRKETGMNREKKEKEREKIPMTNKQIKRYSRSLVIREPNQNYKDTIPHPSGQLKCKRLTVPNMAHI